LLEVGTGGVAFVADAGDLDGDGLSELLVGEPGVAGGDGSPFGGAVHLLFSS
jgi:hypothetical protein